MKYNKELYLLIQSLDSEEKKIVSKQVSKRSIPIRLLFKVYNSKTDPDNEQIKQIPNWSTNQNILKNLILDTIRPLHINKEDEIFCYLKDADILFQKGLYSLGLKVLNKAKQIASEYEYFEYLILIINQEDTLRNLDKHKTIKSDKSFNDLYNEKQYYIDCMQEFLDISRIRIELRQVKEMGSSQTREFNKEMQNLELRLNTLPKNCKSIYNNHLFLSTQVLFKDFKGDSKEAIRISKEMLKNIEQNPFLGKRNPILYIRELITICNQAANLKDSQTFEQYYKKIKSYKAQSIKEDIFIFEKFETMKYAYFFMSDLDYQVIEKELLHTISKYEKLKELFNKETLIVFPLNFSLIYTKMEKLDSALNWILVYFENYKAILPHREDVNRIAMLIELLLYFELNKIKLLKSVSYNHKRKFQRIKKLYNSEKTILKFFCDPKLSNHTNKELTNKVIELKNNLLALMNDPYERNFLTRGFNWISWTERKILKLSENQ